MSLPNTFANETAPGMQELDQNFAAVALMGLWNAVVTGTNAIALTPDANQPAVSAYTNKQKFAFAALNTSNGSVTLQVNSLAALPVYLPSGVQAGSGDITSGTFYILVYLAALNSAAGGFQIVSALPSSVSAPVAIGAARGLVVTNNAITPNTKITITASQAIMVNSGGTPVFASSVTAVIDLTTGTSSAAANGMDGTARPTRGWVYCYLISTGSVTASLASITSPSAGAPALPTGYTYAEYVGAMYCDGSQNLLRSVAHGREAAFKETVSTNTAVIPNIANGIAGTTGGSSPTLAAVTVVGNAGVVPLTAGIIRVSVATNRAAAGVSTVYVAASTAWGGTNNGPSGSAGNVYPMQMASGSDQSGNLDIVLEAATIAWASSAAGGGISCLGWSDYYVNA